MLKISDNYHKGKISIINHHFLMKRHRLNWEQVDISSILKLHFVGADLHIFRHFYRIK